MALSRRAIFTGRHAVAPVGFALPWWRDQPGCDACGRCVEACETQIIQVNPEQRPFVDFSVGECTFCAACVTACPHPLFNAPDSAPWSLRVVLENHCVAFHGVNCRSCQESCEHQAITFRLSALGVGQPVIQPDRCTGCGACIAPCPVSATGLHHA